MRHYQPMRLLDKNNLALQEDWYGGNAAICCFSCGKVFLVSQILHRKGRSCPKCGLTHATVTRTEVVIDETRATQVSRDQARLETLVASIQRTGRQGNDGCNFT